jgi:hypothetical protein
VGDDLRLARGRRHVEGDPHEALPRARLQILERMLVSRVVGDHELESRRRLEKLAGLFDREDAPVIGEWMDDHQCVLSRLDDFVEVADGARPGGRCERTVHPDRLTAANEITSGEIAGREIVVAGDGDERAAEPVGHVRDEAGLAAAGRSLEHDREPALVAGEERRDFVA